ncbi:MAG TPA: prenyltransferase/squalene oxidase repeat-containing protein, partial [Tepidisphaeraceae bacterium]|nr:prenyltransferase/squalene oxidase repeat-containing protein [Tepidisphaeraceae bacterium]
STTVLCWSALRPFGSQNAKVMAAAEAWIAKRAGSMMAGDIASAIVARYGKDKTFSVPILTMATLAWNWDWKIVPQLRFELAALPHRFWATIRLPVVSYALPALIAMGQVRHAKRQTINPLTRIARRLTRRRTLRILQSIQPESGGFLEATPLTSFVVMSLVHAPRTEESEAVIHAGARFLVNSVREDGSWPIDTNLATWVSTLATNALHIDSDFRFGEHERTRLLDWLLDQQHRVEHPYTHAAPGGWAWTDLSGGVPDADDTAGALIALHHLGTDDARAKVAAEEGVRWLLDLQNNDGGIPTFCRGWTNLPFDRSGPDLTAHALLAWRAWEGHVSLSSAVKIRDATARAMKYLEKSQGHGGQWIPLWFGNQATLDDENPTYGTAKVLMAMQGPARKRGMDWLVAAQNRDGGWGGAAGMESSIEETALAVTALAANSEKNSDPVERGTNWLLQRVQSDDMPASAIGFYFAKLWYFEKLYPLIFTVAALSQVRQIIRPRQREP